MEIKHYTKLLIIIFSIYFIGCSARSILTSPNADMKSSLEEITKHKNKKSRIAEKLPKKIGNMELFNVVDYSKQFLVGIDMGYGIFYDLKVDKKGSGNIFLYKRYKNHVKDGLTDDALEELIVERREIEHSENVDSKYLISKFNNLEFYRMYFITPPDVKNEQYYCYLFITGYEGVYLKVLFYYPANSEYGAQETEYFMNELTAALSKNK